MASEPETRFDVAVIGMSGSFPGAKDLRQFWINLTTGVESIRRFTDEELLQRGVDAESLQSPDFVKAASCLEDTDRFAAGFFNYSPREAELMDPQHRLFLEHSWSALEDAGYAPRHLKEQVGVFAGMSLSAYLLFNLVNNPALDSREESFQAMIGADKDFLCTRVSYKLNLKGPSVTVQTGCSTSLVAAHLAVQSLLAFQCDLAITGGVSVGVPQRTGYYHQPGGIASPDGHCRPFDTRAEGTVFGEGVGVLILKRLEDAVRDRDHVYAVVRGSAINNDGSAKVGFTAPSTAGQIDVISRALATAGVAPGTIGYIETHGTATALGDPMEVSALAEVFKLEVQGRKSCALGAVKSNIGHLDAAAGVAGLIKTILMLKNRQMVPTLHFSQANPKIEFDSTPFHVCTESSAWQRGGGLLRAGVSSFGIGGTNAHVVLEESSGVHSPASGRPLHILCLSAGSETALTRMTEDLSLYLKEEGALADVAYTLHAGREQFNCRRVLVASDLSDARNVLSNPSTGRLFTNTLEKSSRRVGFMFPGGGCQYAEMGAELYRDEPVFRNEIDRCSEFLSSVLGYDLRKLIYPAGNDHESSSRKLLRPSAGLPAIFCTEYALARLFVSWGIPPSCMIGHSLGEYTAACLAGVFSVEDALRLVACRGKLFETLAAGSMLSVHLPESELGGLPKGVSIAAINTIDQCVLSGPATLIDRTAQELKTRLVECRRLHIDVAAHCSMVDPILPEFRNFMAQIKLSSPTIPFISNLTGTWITEEQCTDISYWAEHLRHTVRFAQGIRCLGNGGEFVILEVGPGRTLSGFARQQLKHVAKLVFTSMRHPQEATSELLTTYTALARMWSIGVDVDWRNFYQFEQRRRVSLPTYPFERQRYWIDPPSSESRRKSPISTRRSSKRARLFAPTWKGVQASLVKNLHGFGLWIILTDGNGVGPCIASTLKASGQPFVSVKTGSSFGTDAAGNYVVDPSVEGHVQNLFDELGRREESSVNILHLWTLGSSLSSCEGVAFYEAQRHGLYSLLNLTRSLTRFGRAVRSRIVVASNGVAQVSGADPILPEKMPLLAACTVIPQEYDNTTCKLIDLDVRDVSQAAIQRMSAQILTEAVNDSDKIDVVAYRGMHKWVRDYEPIVARNECRLSLPNDRPPVYLITGGLGELGSLLAHHLSEKGPCKIVLTTTSPAFAQRGKWNNLSDDGSQAKQDKKINSLKMLEQAGVDVTVVKADVANKKQMDELFAEIDSAFGGVDGVVHMAGITGDKALKLIADLETTDCQIQFRPKIEGCYVLRDILRHRPVRFCVLFSSTASFLGGPGMLPYTAASCFLDAFASNSYLNDMPWVSVNWDGWISPDSSQFLAQTTALDRNAIPYDAALELLDVVLANALGGQIIVSSADPSDRQAEWRKASQNCAPKGAASAGTRPVLGTEYAAPTDALQAKMATIWSEVLGIERVGVHDNFFELGGSSLIGLRIMARLKRELDADIPVTALFEGPTIFTLAKLIEGRRAAVGAAAQEGYVGSRERGELRRNVRRATSRAG
jgi:phthiocerol/phenolphthiocerol synthesis type-I polyketide synthase E